MRVRKLYYTIAAINGTVNDAAHLDIPQNTNIRAILMNLSITTALGDAKYVRIELSTASSNQLAVNDPNSTLAEINLTTNITTSGAVIDSVSLNLPGLLIPVKQLDRIYIHAIGSGTLTGWCSAYIYCD